MRQYETFELTFPGPEPEGSKALADLQAEFTLNGESKKVSGFYAGEGRYKVRFYPPAPGTCSWKVRGAVNAQGEETCQPANSGETPDFAAHGQKAIPHGIVHVEGKHFKYEDGAWYRPFGTTVYALVHQEKALIDTTMETLRKAQIGRASCRERV